MSSDKQRIVVLISGRGSNMEAIVRTCAAEAWPAQVVAVISSRPQAAGLAFATANGIEALALDHNAYATREAFDAALAHAIDTHAPDLVVLAGFMRVLGPEFVSRYAGRMINVHPSLLPAFTGLHTHRRALAAGVKVAGATVHFVTADLDLGPIVAQAVVPVLPDDDEHTLAQRILVREHVMLPRVVRWFVEGKLTIDGAGRVHVAGGEPQLF
jgi:phosphoribosylglycinamide formyltransferase-1